MPIYEEVKVQEIEGFPQVNFRSVPEPSFASRTVENQYVPNINASASKDAGFQPYYKGSAKVREIDMLQKIEVERNPGSIVSDSYYEDYDIENPLCLEQFQGNESVQQIYSKLAGQASKLLAKGGKSNERQANRILKVCEASKVLIRDPTLVEQEILGSQILGAAMFGSIIADEDQNSSRNSILELHNDMDALLNYSDSNSSDEREANIPNPNSAPPEENALPGFRIEDERSSQLDYYNQIRNEQQNNHLLECEMTDSKRLLLATLGSLQETKVDDIPSSKERREEVEDTIEVMSYVVPQAPPNSRERNAIAAEPDYTFDNDILNLGDCSSDSSKSDSGQV